MRKIVQISSVTVLTMVLFCSPVSPVMAMDSNLDNTQIISSISLDITQLPSSNIEVSITDISGGENVTISLKITNIGTQSGNYQANLEQNGKVITSRDIKLQAGESQTVSFVVERKDKGDYVLTVDNVAVRFSISDIKQGHSGLPSELNIWAVLALLIATILSTTELTLLISKRIKAKKEQKSQAE